MKDAPSTRKKNNDAIQLQTTAQRIKVELLKEKNLECATEAFIDGLYYYRVYFSPACWKDDRKAVTKHLKKITSDTAKYNALKENIMIRVKGCHRPPNHGIGGIHVPAKMARLAKSLSQE